MSDTNTFLAIKARPVKGFRRAGFQFSAVETKTIKKSDLSEDQIEQLINDPNLVVVETSKNGNEQSDTEEADLKQQLADSQDELQKLEAKYKALVEDAEGFKSDVAKAKEETAKVETELNKTQAELKKAQAELKKAAKE